MDNNYDDSANIAKQNKKVLMNSRICQNCLFENRYEEGEQVPKFCSNCGMKFVDIDDNNFNAEIIHNEFETEETDGFEIKENSNRYLQSRNIYIAAGLFGIIILVIILINLGNVTSPKNLDNPQSFSSEISNESIYLDQTTSVYPTETQISENAQEFKNTPLPIDIPPADGIDWSKAINYVGEEVTICGQVMSTKFASSTKGEPTFINLGVPYPDPLRFTILIWGDHRSEFSQDPEIYYSDKYVCVYGLIQYYKGSAEVEVTNPSQITYTK